MNKMENSNTFEHKEKSVAIMQPYLFPYIGYFQLKQAVDTFVFYDDVNFIKNKGINRNYIMRNKTTLLLAQHKLNETNIFPRRYFYPELNQLPYVQPVNMPIAESIAKRILCLPLYLILNKKEVLKIVELIIDHIKPKQ